MTRRGRMTRRELGALATVAFVAWFGRRATAQDPPPAKDRQTPGPDGAPPKAPSPVDVALGWLARHQGESGEWSPRSFVERCIAPACDGIGTAAATIGTTGLGLLPFLAAGETHASGVHKDSVREAAKYIRSLQAADGTLGPKQGARWFDDHLAASACVVELYGLTQSVLLRDMSRDAVAFAVVQRNPDGGWGPGGGASESEITARVAILLRLATMAGIAYDDAARTAALDFVERATDLRTGALLARAPRAGEKPVPAEREDVGLTALGAVARVFGAKDDDAARADPVVRQVADRLARTPPAAWDAGGAESLAAWNHQATLFAQTRGERHIAWNRALERVLVAAQRTDGCARGSWDPRGPGPAGGGRIASTALAALALTWPYRYESRLVAKSEPKSGTDALPPKDPKSPK